MNLGNSDVDQVKGNGPIGFHKKEVIKLTQDVQLVPVLEQYLLSVGELLRYGFSILFEEDGCTIYDKGEDRHVITMLRMGGN